MLQLSQTAATAQCRQERIGQSNRLLLLLMSVIQMGDSTGMTPLHYAAGSGSIENATALLDHGANVHAVTVEDCTALHMSSYKGNHSMCDVLLGAGARVDAVDKFGRTPLMLSAWQGHVMATDVLLMAAANVNHRPPSGETPLFFAAECGSLPTVRRLLRAKANPVLSRVKDGEFQTFLYQSRVGPLDIAAQHGHNDVVRELLEWCGVEGCGGESRGVLALLKASKGGHFQTMTTLLDAGVVDCGEALCGTIKFGGEEAVKMLIARRTDDLDDYVRCRAFNGHGQDGISPIACLFNTNSLRDSSRRRMRRLIDAGAQTNTDSPIIVMRKDSAILVFQDLFIYADHLILENECDGGSGAEGKICGLKGMRSLLLQEDAVHATSWLWGFGSENKTKTKAKKLSTAVRWKKGAVQSRVLSKALTRWVCILLFLLFLLLIHVIL